MLHRHMTRARGGLLAATLLALLLQACGGGTQTASNNSGVGSGGTGSYTNGAISGLGSIIVNGVRYDVDTASVLSEDKASPLAADLQIGMVVEVDGGAVTPGTGGARDTAKAMRVRYASELVGEVVNPVGGASTTEFTVMGQRVVINARTVPLESPLQAGDEVVVHGLPIAVGQFAATRIEVLSPQPYYKISGVVVAPVDRMTSTIRIGAGPQVVTFSGPLPPGVVEGGYVRVRVIRATPPTSSWMALSGGVGVRTQLVSEERRGRLEGVIQGFDGSLSGTINGTTVNFAAVRSMLRASPNGQRVEVEGLYRSGVLVASRVEVDDDSRPGENELHGFISSFDAGPRTFQLRGLAVDYSSAVVEPGLVLGNTVCVEVKGTLLNANSLKATEVKRESDCRP